MADGALARMGGPGRLCNGLLHVIIIGCAICVIVINRYQLFDILYWVYVPYWPFYEYLGVCAYSLTETTPCNYLYALGALSLVASVIIVPIGCCARGNVCLLITELIFSICLAAWWLAGAIYFTDQYNDLDDGGVSTVNDYRQAIMAVSWTAFACSVIACASSIWSFMVARKAGGKKDHEHVPTAATVPPQAHGGYAYPPPPDPMSGYPPAPPPAAPYYPPAAGAPPPAAYPPPSAYPAVPS